VLRTVKELFKAQYLMKRLKDEEEKEKEDRLERRKRLERGWKEKRNHYQKIRWASEWLAEVAIEQAVTTGHSLVRGRMTSLVMDLVDEVVEKGTSRASCGLDTNIQKKERLRRAERKMECLVRNLETLWTVMGAGVPGGESFQEPHLGVMAGKRKREPDRDEIESLNDQIKVLTVDLSRLELNKINIKIKVDPPEVSNEGRDSTTFCKPVASPVADMIHKFESMRGIAVQKDGRNFVKKSPVKDLIQIFEKDDEDMKNVMANFDCEKNVSVNNLNDPARKIAKPAEENSVPDGRKMKKKVWMRLKSGLFGWKMVTVKPAVAETSHTSITKSKAGQSEVKKISNNIIFKKWRLTAGGGVGRVQHSELPVKQTLEIGKLNNKAGGKSGDKK
jgi:hypothetical protein